MTTDIKAELRDLSVGLTRFKNRDLLMRAADRIAELERRQIPSSWASDGSEWSAISGDGVLDVRGSKADIDVVVSWRQAKDRLAWFEDEYKRSQGREYALKLQVEQLEERLKSDSRLREVATEAHLSLKARYDRLLTAFHDATRRPLGVTPDSGLEFYDARMADEAEARRSRYGRGPK